MKQVKTKTGVTGWQSRLREQYENDFELFEAYDSNYNNAARLGYKSAKEAWDANPVIQGSTNPEDYRTVLDEHNRCEFMREEVEAVTLKFLLGKITKEQFIGKLKGFDGRLKGMFGKKGEKSIWFRTYKGHTGATTIQNLEKDLSLPASHENYKYLLECLELGAKELGMEVYFS